MDERSLAYPSPAKLDEEAPHGYYDGWIYLGFEPEEDGELVEVTDRVRCRRCQQSLDSR